MDELRRNNIHLEHIRDESSPVHSPREIREVQQPWHLPVQNCFGNLYPLQDCSKRLNWKPKQEQKNILGQTIWLPEDTRGHNTMNCGNRDRSENKKYENKPKTREKCVQGVNLSTSYQDGKDNSHRNPIIYQNRMYDIVQGSSYICEPIDNKDMQGIKNLKDEIILKCSPRRHKTPNIKQSDERNEINIDGYVHPLADEVRLGITHDEKNHDFNETPYEHQQVNLANTAFLRQDSIDQHPPLSNHFHERKFLKSYPEEIYGMQRIMRCKRLYKSFKRCLWALFYTSVLLVIIGMILLILVLLHFVDKNYISIVVERSGFVICLWIILILSVFIVAVGVYGINASIDRSKRQIKTYCVTAFVLAFLIFLFLVFLWLSFVNIKDVQHDSMRNTIKNYRCERHIQRAWDQLHQSFKCCGVEDQTDWKYVPPTCCNATSKQDKVACIKQFISVKQAFSNGCRSKLEEYFTILLVITAVLLLLALLLLILSILVTLWLLRKYKRVVNCQEIYYAHQGSR